MLKSSIELFQDAINAVQAGDPDRALHRAIAAWLAAGIPCIDKDRQKVLDRDRVQELAEYEIDDDVIIAIFSRDEEEPTKLQLAED